MLTETIWCTCTWRPVSLWHAYFIILNWVSFTVIIPVELEIVSIHDCHLNQPYIYIYLCIVLAQQ